MQDNRIVIGNARFTVLTEQLLRIEYDKAGNFEERSTQTVINRKFPNAVFECSQNDETFELNTSALRLIYKKGKSFSPQSLRIDIKNNLTSYHNRWFYGADIENLKGTARTLDEADGSIPLEDGIMSKQGFSLLDDSHTLILNQDSDLEINRQNQIDIYFFCYGREYERALHDYFVLTGFPPLLPRYALGNWWSRFWRYTEESYLNVIDRFESEGIPLAVSVIDMDWHITSIPARFGSGWTGYTWNEELFPDPERFLNTLHEKGLKTSLNVHPAEGIRAFEKSYSVVAKKLGLDKNTEEPAEFAIEDALFRECYFKDVHEPLEKQGVDFWWIDWQQGTQTGQKGMDPLWMLNHYHYNDIQKKKQNDIILSRYAGPGSHRYPIGFSGDTYITWESLRFQPYFTATASNIGYTWWSHDIGGHMHGASNNELMIRWTQFGVFSPINRLHSSDNMFASKEPWAFDKATHEVLRKFLILRHQLLPYLYTMNVYTHERGLPLIKPMYYDYPYDEEAYHVPNQYTFGTELLVLPITEKTSTKTHLGHVKGYLPEGTWIDMFTKLKYRGGSIQDFYRPIEQLPIFVKAGTILPLDKEAFTTKNQLPETITWQLYPGEDAEFELIEDIGTRRARTICRYQQETKEITIHVEDPYQLLPNNRKHFVDIQGTVDSSVVPITEQKIVKLQISETSNAWQEILFERLDMMDLPYDLKKALFERMIHTKSYQERTMIIANLEDLNLQKVLFEILYLSDPRL